MSIFSPDSAFSAADGVQDEALVELLAALKAQHYRFITPTPATHSRVLANRPGQQALNLRDVLGWSLPFEPEVLPSPVLALLQTARAVESLPDGRFRSLYRVSTLGKDLLLHSAYPTSSADAVFFGPDSYRFVDFVLGEMTRHPPRPGESLVDIGTGAGAGAIAAARAFPELRITMTDINPQALTLARVNAHAAGLFCDMALGAYLDPVAGQVDRIIANPPYMADDEKRAYRDGGQWHGAQISMEIARRALPRLRPGGQLYLYSGSAIVAGEDRMRAALERLAREHGCTMHYREIDPDVFGEELDRPLYRHVERIAAIGAVLALPKSPNMG